MRADDTDLCLGMETPVRSACTQGAGLGGSHQCLENGGCFKVGEPAGALFDATTLNDQHQYDDRSLQETDRGSCNVGSLDDWDRPGFGEGPRRSLRIGGPRSGERS